jgi:hypothetical protein
MSLDWSVESMKNFDVLTTLTGDSPADLDRKWLPLTEALVWATMHIGINSITEKNWQEFYYRLNKWERLTGTSLRVFNSEVTRYITPLEVYMHIGLYTNASSLSKKEFNEKLERNYKREVVGLVTKAPEQYKEAGLADMTEKFYQKLWRDLGYTLDDKLAANALLLERT